MGPTVLNQSIELLAQRRDVVGRQNPILNLKSVLIECCGPTTIQSDPAELDSAAMQIRCDCEPA